MKSLDDLLERERTWAMSMRPCDPQFFARLSEQQSPQYPQLALGGPGSSCTTA